MTSAYQIEQSETLSGVYRMIRDLVPSERYHLMNSCAEYLQFRRDVDLFLSRNFNDICTKNCYENRQSACCSREGIITFFADVVTNVLCSEALGMASLLSALEGEGKAGKCIYLGDDGCLWRLKPIVCQMFLCDRAKDQVFDEDPGCRMEWETLEGRRKGFTWPDKPVLFDDLERHFMDAGIESPLMYLHNSPGLLSLKRRAGLVTHDC